MAVAAFVLPMAACGSSQPAAKLPSSGTSTGTSGTPTTASASPTPTTAASSASPTAASSSSATAAGGLPDLTLPSDVTLQFNLPKTGDPAKDAALQGLAQAEKAVYKATELGVNAGPLLDDFFVGQGPMMVGQYMSLKKDNGTTVTGTTVYYNWKFTGSTDHNAYQITYCQDQNKFFDKNRATGQTVPQQSGLGQLISYKVDMVLDKDGRWKDGYYFWKSGDTACQVDGH